MPVYLAPVAVAPEEPVAVAEVAPTVEESVAPEVGEVVPTEEEPTAPEVGEAPAPQTPAQRREGGPTKIHLQKPRPSRPREQRR